MTARRRRFGAICQSCYVCGVRNNSRHGNRVKRRLPIKLAGAAAFTIDVSPGGFCAELMRVPVAGTPVSGTISIAGHDYPFSGRIAWARAGEPRMNLRGRIGVSFTQIPSEFASAAT